MEATRTTRLLHCELEQIKYIYFKDAFKVGPGAHSKNAPIGKDVFRNWTEFIAVLLRLPPKKGKNPRHDTRLVK